MSGLLQSVVISTWCFGLPRASREGAYFFRYLWEGCNRFEQEAIDCGMVERVEFGVGGYADALEQIDERLQVGEKIDGLLAQRT